MIFTKPRYGYSFNPLPPPKRGETFTTEHFRNDVICFNPLPPPKRGETLQGLGRCCVRLVFQSTPRDLAQEKWTG